MAREVQIKGLGNLPWLEIDKDALGFFVKGVDINDTTSIQMIAADLNAAAGMGSSTAASPSYNAAMMGNVISKAALTATKAIIAGVIGKFDVSAAISSTYPSAGVVGEIGDVTVDTLTAAVLAVMGGDSGKNVCGAMFGVDWHNSTPTSEADYGLDLEGATHDSYLAPRYRLGHVRLGGRFSNAGIVETVNDLLVLAGTAAPTNGTSGTGAGNAGAGSLYVRQSGANSKIYINGNTKASPTWNLVTSA